MRNREIKSTGHRTSVTKSERERERWKFCRNAIELENVWVVFLQHRAHCGYCVVISKAISFWGQGGEILEEMICEEVMGVPY